MRLYRLYLYYLLQIDHAVIHPATIHMTWRGPEKDPSHASPIPESVSFGVLTTASSCCVTRARTIIRQSRKGDVGEPLPWPKRCQHSRLSRYPSSRLPHRATCQSPPWQSRGDIPTSQGGENKKLDLVVIIWQHKKSIHLPHPAPTGIFGRPHIVNLTSIRRLRCRSTLRFWTTVGAEASQRWGENTPQCLAMLHPYGASCLC